MAADRSTGPVDRAADRPADAGALVTGILHVDMDAFFASVETLDDPSLAGLPLIVGGEGPRGVVASCSYEARRFGVRSAMPSTEARRRCPAAVFVRGRHDRYAEVSERLHAILRDATPLVEPIALDEAFLDVEGASRLIGTPVEIAHGLRSRVADELHLSCSVGVARSKLLAKLASRSAKPRASAAGIEAGPGVFVIAPEDEIAFLHPMPVRALWGVGPRTAERLARYGLVTVADVAAVGRPALERLLGQAQGGQLAELAWGRDPRAVDPARPLKSVGHEETFAVDDRDPASLRRHAVRMSESVASRLRAGSLAGRTVTVKVRFADFTTITRSRTLPNPTASGSQISPTACMLVEQLDVSPGVRLLGVSVSALTPGTFALSEQLSFDGVAGGRPGGPVARGRTADPATRRELDDALDAVRQRFGSSAVVPVSEALRLAPAETDEEAGAGGVSSHG
jgi:DNA polymerase-4